MSFDREVVIVGGCGHVGLPLGQAFADLGLPDPTAPVLAAETPSA
jgi:hypothetical protein